MLHGIMKGDEVLLVAEGDGLPVVESPEPEAPEGYGARCSYVQAGGQIRQVWSLVPDEGTAQEAAVALARMQAASLPDEDALSVAALYDEWDGSGVEYEQWQRVRFQGWLVKCLQGHVSQPDWTPNAAPSLWARILPGQDGSGVDVGEWEQPGSESGYAKGDRVSHAGKVWESLVDANVWEPGAHGSETVWKEVSE